MKLKVNPVLLSYPMSWVYRLWCLTIRFTLENVAPLEREWAQGNLLTVGCWHNELFAFPANQMGKKWAGIASLSEDGAIAAGLVNRVGIATARGSSSRGGVRALMGACRLMKKEHRNGFVTVDGPRGPRHKVKEGVIFLAQKSRTKLVPVRIFPSRSYVFEKAWDKFILPHPFSSCRIVFGEPYEVTTEKLRGEVLAAEIQKFEDKMNALG
ncbi:lysophospholipid acyltransferase family protein [Desulfobaculum bizertense]|uniref:DUF374 domain-containing protein n=1 Tax=Desulfobaculum bizertense DSM 18034 TaxID=1121442 RepID=A0A1T4W1T3_9BACT|nr:lysophospholipid acyltransferase family protein [Desulfobaculum bizertense]UIJ38884.1 lysophospholipid acyltransferase family protein [Desulfobaculum bizertense]SKA71212.1 hypothetical protein SAMN02745702_01434 [Desulfobaculum bizertense DSM 18034]